MAKGISINFLANVRDFVKGTDNVERALDDVSDSLADTARDGDRSTTKLEKSFKELQKTAKSESRTIGNDLGSSVKRGTKEAGEGLQEFKDESKSTAREAAASFSGSAEDIGSTFQEVLANAFAGFGPAGAAAGIAAAVGFGALTAAVQQNAQESEERVRAMYDDMAESRNSFLSEGFIKDALKELINDEGRRTAAMEDSIATGLDYNVVLRAQAGDSEALAIVTSTAASKAAELEAANRKVIETTGDSSAKIEEQIGSLDVLSKRYAGVGGEISDAAFKAGLFDQATADITSSAQNAAGAIDGITAAVGRVPGKFTVTPTIDESALDRALARPRRIRVDLEGFGRNGQRVI